MEVNQQEQRKHVKNITSFVLYWKLGMGSFVHWILFRNKYYLKQGLNMQENVRPCAVSVEWRVCKSLLCWLSLAPCTPAFSAAWPVCVQEAGLRGWDHWTPHLAVCWAWPMASPGRRQETGDRRECSCSVYFLSQASPCQVSVHSVWYFFNLFFFFTE